LEAYLQKTSAPTLVQLTPPTKWERSPLTLPTCSVLWQCISVSLVSQMLAASQDAPSYQSAAHA